MFHIIDTTTPADIRTKETNEYVDCYEFAEKLKELFHNDNIEEAKALIENHKYRWEEKCYFMDVGKPII